MTTSRAPSGPDDVATVQPGARLRETARVALLHPAAALHEERRVALRQPLRVGRRQGIGEMGAAERGRADMGLERLERGPVEQNRRDPVRLQFLDFLVHRLLAARAAPDLDPAGLAQQGAGPGRLGELAVLGARSPDQRRHRPRRFVASGRGGGLEISPQRGRDRGKRAIADMGARVAVERGERDLGQVAREHVREDRLALDDAGVAEARLARRLVEAVDDRDRPPARLKRQRGRDADDPGAEHDHVDGSRRHKRTPAL